jgi:hypothetical protein
MDEKEGKHGSKCGWKEGENGKELKKKKGGKEGRETRETRKERKETKGRKRKEGKEREEKGKERNGKGKEGRTHTSRMLDNQLSPGQERRHPTLSAFEGGGREVVKDQEAGERKREDET